MKWRTDYPTKPGKYIVETISTMGNIHRLEATFTPNEKDKSKGTWGFNNQFFKRWLDETKTETVMVCIPVDYTNSRKVCELIQNCEYDSMVDLRNYLDKELEVDYDDEETEKPIFFDLNDFMDECNDQYLNIENYFISYVEIIKK